MDLLSGCDAVSQLLDIQAEIRRCFGMAYKISDACISCGACAAECPVSCISEGDSAYVIDAEACLECGACASVCPVGAPEQE